jgi:hypothetical protein
MQYGVEIQWSCKAINSELGFILNVIVITPLLLPGVNTLCSTTERVGRSQDTKLLISTMSLIVLFLLLMILWCLGVTFVSLLALSLQADILSD